MLLHSSEASRHSSKLHEPPLCKTRPGSKTILLYMGDGMQTRNCLSLNVMPVPAPRHLTLESTEQIPKSVSTGDKHAASPMESIWVAAFFFATARQDAGLLPSAAWTPFVKPSNPLEIEILFLVQETGHLVRAIQSVVVCGILNQSERITRTYCYCPINGHLPFLGISNLHRLRIPFGSEKC